MPSIFPNFSDKNAIHAPCIRLMEQPQGNLHIVTIMGASIGRINCDVNLDDENSSRVSQHGKLAQTPQLSWFNALRINGNNLTDIYYIR